MAHQQKLKDQTRSLAKFVQKLAEETQDELNKAHRLIEQKNEVLAAVVRLLGVEEVQATIDEMRSEQAERLLEQQKEGVKFLVEKKVLVPVEVVEHPAGFIVGTDKLPDGTEKRVQFEMSRISPEFAPLYVGKKVGETVEGSQGTVMTIVEVYKLDAARADEVMKEEAATSAAPPDAKLPESESPAALPAESE